MEAKLDFSATYMLGVHGDAWKADILCLPAVR